MSNQKSLCCYAGIKLTGKDRPDAFECEKCGRIIGTDLPAAGEQKAVKEIVEEFGNHLYNGYDVYAKDHLRQTLKAERQKQAELVKAERERVCDIYEEALSNNINETLWGDEDSNEVMKQSIDAFIAAVDVEVTKALTQPDNQQ